MGLFLNMLRGFCMALADSVPGVSGGTIAFVLGFYDEFIGSLYFLTHGTTEQKKKRAAISGKIRSWLDYRHGRFCAAFG